MTGPSARLRTAASPSEPSSSTNPTNANRTNRGDSGPHESASTGYEAGTAKDKSGKSKGKARADGKTKVKEKKGHKCTFEGCDKVFITPAHVRRHLRTHTGTQPYACEFCEKRFARSDVRNRHMQLSHKELYDNWLASLPPDRRRQGSKQVDDDAMGNDGEEVENSGGEDADELNDEEDVGTRGDRRPFPGSAEPGHSEGMDVDFGIDRDQQSARQRRRSMSGRPSFTNYAHDDIQDSRLQQSRLQHDGEYISSSGPADSLRPHEFISPADPVRDPRATDTDVPQRIPAHTERFSNVPFRRPDDRDPSRAMYALPSQFDQQHSSHTYAHPGNSISAGQEFQRVQSSRQSVPQNVDDDTSRDQGEMFSRLDILLAAAAEPDPRQSSGHAGDARMSALSLASEYVGEASNGGQAQSRSERMMETSHGGTYNQSQVLGPMPSTADLELLNSMNPAVQSSSSTFPFPQNNPNSSLTPEAFIASTISLNSGTIPSVVSGSPLDVYGIDFDMGLYHDVFGWGLGAADVQQQAMGGQGSAELGAWAYDMLDLSALNNPTEFVGRGVAGGSGMNAGALSNFVAHLEGGTLPPHQPTESGARDVDQGKRLDPDAIPSGRPSGRTTRQGTATPGNGEEETPWPHVFRPAAIPFERPLALPYAIKAPTDSSDSFLSGPQQVQVSSTLHASILRLVKMCHGMSPWREPDYTNFPSTQVLSHCVGLYFIHFHPILPILRPKAYMDEQGVYQAAKGSKSAHGANTASSVAQTRDEAYHTLLTLTVAAIGAAYAEDRMKPLGGYLMELARRTGSYLQLSDPRSIFSIPYIQSRLLIAVGGVADGSRERYLMSEVSKGLLVTAARRLHLLRHRPTRPRLTRHRTTNKASGHSAARDPLPKDSKAEWREWRDEEERLRLGWAIFIFDSQAAAFLNIPSAFSLNEIQVRLPDTEEMWNMSNASMWDEANRSRKVSLNKEDPSPFGTILSNMIRQGRLQERVSEFGKWILAHSLYRLCDAANMQNILMGYTEPVHPPLSDSFSRPDQRNPFILLGLLVNSWQSDVSFAKPSPFFASSNVLRHYSNIRFILPTFLDHVQQAAGKISVSASKEGSQQWLKEFPTESVLRRIFVESIQLAVFLLHSRLDAPWEPVILLDCALSLWAILRFRPEVLQLSASSPGSTIMRSGSRSTEYLERWITEGGPLKIQGMSYSMTPDNVLTDFVTRLQDSPWGLSCLYAAVLNNLRPKEQKA